MGHGLDPAPTNDLGIGITIDNGTLIRNESPTPGPVGLDSGDSNKNQAAMAQQIMNFIKQKMGTHHGDGQCFTLADDALKNAGAKSAGDFGKVTKDADYVWGTSVKKTDAQPGDVIQFRNYRYDRKIETNNPDGSGSTDNDFQERPHHTAVVEKVNGDGSMVVLEQNAPEGEAVIRSTLYFTSGSSESGNTKTTIQVKGTVRFYRPQAR